MADQAKSAVIVTKKTRVSSSRRWSLVIILFLFMLLHQTDKLLIGPLTTPIMETFGIDESQMGIVFTGALLVGGIFYPLWGWLFDRYARPKILALAAVIWGATTWLSAIAPGYPLFVATRASTGIDDASYPGAYSLVSDYFGPNRRGRIISILQLSAFAGGIISMGLAMFARDTIGWRNIFFITGGLGLVIAAVMFFGIKELPRGQAEPEMEGKEQVVTQRFSWETVKVLLKRPTLVLLFTQQFFHVFPFTAINSWFFRYLETERGLDSGMVFVAAGLMAVMGAISGVVAGTLGDALFKRFHRGRLLVAVVGLACMMIFFTLMLNSPVDQVPLFLVLEALAGFFWSFEWPNMVSTLQDVTEPEVRSTAHGIIGIAENVGSALSPMVAGFIAVNSTLKNAMQTITLSAWSVGLVLLVVLLIVIPKDVERLRAVMRQRAAQNE